MDFRERFPARSFLLKDRRIMIRRGDGTLDPTAIRNAYDLVQRVPNVEPATRERMQKSLSRILCLGDGVKKGAWSFGDLEAAGLLHTLFGFPVIIEVRDGQKRTGTGTDGQRWERTLTGMSYGFLPDTFGADAEELDVIVGEDVNASMAYAIDQGDEIKLALGYASLDDAHRVYCENWPPEMMKAIYEVPMSLVRSLLCAEPSALGETISAMRKADSVLVLNGGLSLGTITKAALPTPPAPADESGSTGSSGSDHDGMRQERMLKAFDTAKLREPSPLSMTEDLKEHPALRLQLTGVFPDPMAVGGWLGWIEPDDETWIAFVEVSGRGLLWTQRDATGGVEGAPFLFQRDDLATKQIVRRSLEMLPVVKAAEEEREFVVFGVVLEPEPNGGAGDLHRETYSEGFVRQTAHEYTAFFMNLDDQHGEFLPPTKAVVVESYVTKQPEQWGARTVKAGSWICGVRIVDPELKRQILAGEKTGLSIEGFAERVPNTPSAQQP